MFYEFSFFFPDGRLRLDLAAAAAVSKWPRTTPLAVVGVYLLRVVQCGGGAELDSYLIDLTDREICTWVEVAEMTLHDADHLIGVESPRINLTLHKLITQCRARQ